MRVELSVSQQTVERTENVFDVQFAPVQQTVEIDKGTLNLTYDGNTETVVAAEALGGHRVITTDGYYADASNTTHAYRVFGVTIGAASIGTVATVRTFGEIAESGWNWTMGEPVFLGANGNVTQTPPSAPSLCVVIGRPKNATTLFVDIQETVFLG